MSAFIYWNGSIIPQEEFRISVNSRGLRYGDGLFETMKTSAGNIFLEDLHFNRLFSSLQILQFDIPAELTPVYLREQILLLLEANRHMDLARVRLMATREESAMRILIQSWSLERQLEPAANNLFAIEIFPDARKTYDLYSGLKSNNYLCYLMGADFAKKRGLDDVIVLNAHGRIADATIANVFVVKDGLIKTPPLSEGCVNGVYRRYLLQCFIKDSIAFNEQPLTPEDLISANEVFLTNAIRGIYSVDRFRNSFYNREIGTRLREAYELV